MLQGRRGPPRRGGGVFIKDHQVVGLTFLGAVFVLFLVIGAMSLGIPIRHTHGMEEDGRNGVYKSKPSHRLRQVDGDVSPTAFYHLPPNSSGEKALFLWVIGGGRAGQGEGGLQNRQVIPPVSSPLSSSSQKCVKKMFKNVIAYGW